MFSGAKILPVRTLAINLDSVRALAQQVNASCEKVFAAKNKSASSESRWNMNIEINTSSECAQSRVMKFTRASAAKQFSLRTSLEIICVWVRTRRRERKASGAESCLIWPVIKERMDHLVGPRGTGGIFVLPLALEFLFYSIYLLNNTYLRSGAPLRLQGQFF